MKENREEYLKIIEDLNGDPCGQEKALSYIADSDIWVHGKPVPFSYVPYLFDSTDITFLRSICKTTYTILTKVITRYVEDPVYRELFGFSKELEYLITLPCDYSEKLPLARFDLFMDEEDREYKFCEFNTDGSGAMSRDLEVGRALMLGDTYKEFARRHNVAQFELFDSWVEAFMESYRECPYAQANPTIAVTDFTESGVFTDFNRFIAAFEKAGYSARFVDVREFVFDGNHLVDPSDGMIIDAVYRRAVTSEILQHPGECDDLIDAVAARKVCLIGHFRTTVVHSKVISIVLFSEKTREFLSEKECAFIDKHLPRTFYFRNDASIDLERIKAEKEKWIIKPEDDYGAHGVYPGIDLSSSEWEKVIEANLDAGYIIQEYYQPHEVELVVPHTKKSGNLFQIEAWQSMPGMYVYNGDFKGLYCRNGQKGIIALDHGGLCSSSFMVDARDSD